MNNICNAQNIFFLTGKNFTEYKLKYNGEGSVNTLDKKGGGDSYEIGFAIPIKIQRLAFDNNLNYTIGLTLNEYNAVAGNNVNNYEWQTEYIGIQNMLVYSFVKSNYLDLAVKGGFNASTLLYGTQLINNSRYDLKNHDDFSGLIVIPSLGIQAKCNLSEYGYLSLGYSFSKSFNMTNDTNKKLFFLINQIVFGISFELY